MHASFQDQVPEALLALQPDQQGTLPRDLLDVLLQGVRHLLLAQGVRDVEGGQPDRRGVEVLEDVDRLPLLRALRDRQAGDRRGAEQLLQLRHELVQAPVLVAFPTLGALHGPLPLIGAGEAGGARLKEAHRQPSPVVLLGRVLVQGLGPLAPLHPGGRVTAVVPALEPDVVA